MPAETFGIREFVNLFVQIILFYLRHKEVIDNLLPGDLPAHMDALANGLDGVKALNPDGPL